jgi:hypothetical protein
MILSSSRIYFFGVIYKQHQWLSLLDANELSGLLANEIKDNIPDLKPKNIQIINVYKSGVGKCEIHINKIKYKEERTLDKDVIAELLKVLRAQFAKIKNFSYDQVHFVNDEFTRQPSAGFLREDMFYV